MCGYSLAVRARRGTGVPGRTVLLDLLLLLLVIGAVTYGWSWRPWRAKSSAFPPQTIGSDLAPELPSQTPALSALIPPPTETTRPTPAFSAAPTATRLPGAVPSASPTAARSATATRTPQAPTSQPSAASTATAAYTPSPLPPSTPEPTRFHVIVSGDTLRALALRYGIETSLLAEFNPGLDPQRLQIGQELAIPQPGASRDVGGPSESGAWSRVVTHTVESGETLLGIAAEYAVTLNDIYSLNPDAQPQNLLPGQVLRIGLGLPTATATSTPQPTPTPLPYSAPVLLGPLPGEEFQGADARILLWWAAVGSLDAEEWYAVRLDHAGEQTESWTRVPSWRVPSELRPHEGEPAMFRWEVTVVRAEGETDAQVTSPASAPRSFYWR